MLHKQKFDEAERFAKQFNLDVEVKGIELQDIQSNPTTLSIKSYNYFLQVKDYHNMTIKSKGLCF